MSECNYLECRVVILNLLGSVIGIRDGGMKINDAVCVM